MLRSLSALPPVTASLLFVCSGYAFAQEDALKTHISTVVSLVESEYRDRVVDFLSEAPTKATGLTVDAMLAKNEINGIDPRMAYVRRSSIFEVFGRIASNTARRPEDRTYAISLLSRLASNDPDLRDKIHAILQPISEAGEGRAQRRAEAVIKRLDAMPQPNSPRDRVADLNEALLNRDSEAAMSCFHLIDDDSRLERTIPNLKTVVVIVDSERILDLAIVVVKNGRDFDPICLIKIDDAWKICRDVSEFTLPTSSHREARSMVDAMDALQTWYKLKRQQLLAAGREAQ